MRFACFLIVTSLLGIFASAQTTDNHGEFVFVRRQIRGTKSFVPKSGFVPNKDTAVAIAYAVAVPVYGKAEVDGEKPLRAEESAGVWMVLGIFHGSPSTQGGTLIVEIDKITGRVLYLNHSQ